MRAVVQRVSEARVEIEQRVRGQISKGLLILLGVEDSDNRDDADWLAAKIAGMRIFADEEGKMNRSLAEANGHALVVSQFTLHASTKKGNRPSFIRAARPEISEPLYGYFCEKLGSLLGNEVQTGTFGASMQVYLVNDGPVTILVDTKNKE